MSQTTYAYDAAQAVAGQKADSGEDYHVESVVASADIPAGRFVKIDRTTDKVALPDDTDNEIFGVALYVDTLVGGSAIHKAGTVVPVLRKGRVWVDCQAGTMTAGLPVRVHLDDAGAPTHQGKATGSAASADVISPDLEGVKFGRKSASATLKVVELNLPAS